jgi:hypothetical protein
MAALAHLDAEEVRLEVESEQASISASAGSSGVSRAEYGRLLERWARLTRGILEALDVPIGVTVERVSTFESEVVWIVAVGEHDGPRFYKRLSGELGIAGVGHGREQKPDCCGDDGWPTIGTTRA